MNLKKLYRGVLICGLVIAMTGVYQPEIARAYNDPGDGSGSSGSSATSTKKDDPPVSAAECKTSILPCPKDGENGIIWLLKEAIKIISGLVGVVAVVMFIFAGVSYAAAGDSADKVQKAKEMMLNTTIGILLYLFLFAILNFLIPGGLIT